MNSCGEFAFRLSTACARYTVKSAFVFTCDKSRVRGICLVFVSSSILYCTGVFPCWRLSLVFSFQESLLYVSKTSITSSNPVVKPVSLSLKFSARSFTVPNVPFFILRHLLDKNHSIDNCNLCN